MCMRSVLVLPVKKHDVRLIETSSLDVIAIPVSNMKRAGR